MVSSEKTPNRHKQIVNACGTEITVVTLWFALPAKPLVTPIANRLFFQFYMRAWRSSWEGLQFRMLSRHLLTALAPTKPDSFAAFNKSAFERTVSE